MEEIIINLLTKLKPFLTVLIIFFFTIIIQKVVSKSMKKHLKKSTKHLKIDETNYKFLVHFISALIYVVGIGLAIYSVPTLRTLSVSLFAGAGIVAVIIGFASQQTFSNIISGILLTISKPFRVGDRISLSGDLMGIVEDINLMHTVIKTFENKRIMIPNSVISNERIENASIVEEKVCQFINFPISYDSDVEKAMKIMREEVEKHPLCLDNRTNQKKENKEPKVVTRLIGFGDYSVNLRAWAWAKDSLSGYLLNCDVNKSIKKRFEKEGIEIPYPHRTIVYKDKKKKI